MRTFALALGLLAAQGGTPPLPRVMVLSGVAFPFQPFDGAMVNGVLKANIPAPIPGPVGPPGPIGASSTIPGPVGPPGTQLVGVPCVSSDGQPTLMVPLPDGLCLPLVVVTGDGPSVALLDPTGISYKPSGWKLAGIVVP